MRMTPRVIVKKLIRRWSISSSARCCDRHALLMISWFTTMSQKNVSDNGSDWCSDTTRRIIKDTQQGRRAGTLSPKSMLSWVQMSFRNKKISICLRITLSNTLIITDVRENRTIVTGNFSITWLQNGDNRTFFEGWVNDTRI